MIYDPVRSGGIRAGLKVKEPGRRSESIFVVSPGQRNVLREVQNSPGELC